MRAGQGRPTEVRPTVVATPQKAFLESSQASPIFVAWGLVRGWPYCGVCPEPPRPSQNLALTRGFTRWS